MRFFSCFTAVLILHLTLAAAGASPGNANPSSKSAFSAADTTASPEGAASGAEATAPAWVLAVHGGAGSMSRDRAPEEVEAYRKALRTALRLGGEVLENGGTSVDAVERVIRSLEDDPLFNAGKGAVFTHEGTHELDATIMDGASLDCGAVTGVRNVKNPISLARLVMEKSRHVFLAGPGAMAFAAEMGVEQVDDDYFFNQRRYDYWRKTLKKDTFWKDEDRKKGTVGCVALDRDGNLAAGTSTGGITNKRFGRVGDSAVIGSGTYANNRTCAISCTEASVISKSVAWAGCAASTPKLSLRGLQKKAREKRRTIVLPEGQEERILRAADSVIHGKLPPGEGGLVGLSHDGDVVFSFSTPMMFRGFTDASGRMDVKVWKD